MTTGTNELSRTLFDMADHQVNYDKKVALVVAGAIISHYLTTKGYYENQAIRSMERSIERGELVF